MCPGCLAGFALEAPEDLETLGPYRLLEVLGSGGTGIVYRAEHLELKKSVALKVLRPHLTETEQERFRHEARTLAKIRHPNIVSIHDFGFERGWFWLVMDLVSGRPLSERLDQPRGTLVEIVRKSALAVHCLHEQGILHRDLKPQNILLEESGDPRIADFGLAKSPGASLTPTQALLGTPAYMSPEQARGEDLDVRSDVYALGAVLYECLTGHPPFVGRSPTEILQRVVLEDPPAPKADPGLDRICLQAMAKDRARRYSSAAAFAEDLRRHLEGGTIVARRPGVQPARFFRRRAVPFLLAALGILIAAVAALLLQPAAGPALLFAWPTRPATIEELVARMPDKNIHGMMGEGLARYRKGDSLMAGGYFLKCADYVEHRTAGLNPEQREWVLRTCLAYAALCQWRIHNPEMALQCLRKAVAHGFTNDGSLDGDEAFRAMKADPRFAGILTSR